MLTEEKSLKSLNKFYERVINVKNESFAKTDPF